MNKLLLLILLLAGSAAQAATIYECTNAKGKKTYTDKPCKGSNTSVKTYQLKGPSETGSKPSADRAASNKRLKQAWEKGKLTTAIKKSRRNIVRYQKRMSAEIRRLEKEQGYAANNLAGAQYHASLSTQMNSVTRKYSTLIDAERERIKVNEERLKELKKTL